MIKVSVNGKKLRKFILSSTLFLSAVGGGFAYLSHTEPLTREERIENLIGTYKEEAPAKPTYQETLNQRQSNLGALLSKIEQGQTTKEDLVLQVKSKPVPYVTPEAMDHFEECKNKFTASSPGMVLECMKTEENIRQTEQQRMKRVGGVLAAAFAVVGLAGLGVRRSRKKKALNAKMSDRMANIGKNATGQQPAGGVTNNQTSKPGNKAP